MLIVLPFGKATIMRYHGAGDGSVIRRVAGWQISSELIGEELTELTDPLRIPLLAVREKRTIHAYPTPNATELFFKTARKAKMLHGAKVMAATPLLTEGKAIGCIVVSRKELRPLTIQEIGALKTFADQAVIAIENVRLFNELEEKNQQLEIANRHKSQFLANVSHELRTPLNSIMGFTRLVLRKTEGQIENAQKENLHKVLVSAEHLLKLINGLLDLAKIEAGRMEVYAETFKIDEVVRIATATVEPMLKNDKVRLVTEISPELPAIKTDRDKHKQVVLNLFSNSAKFTEAGEIKVAAWSENDSLKLAISDTGIGMKKEALKHIFEEFQQAEKTTASKYGGTGLGLAIVQKFINLMGGKIGVESEVGKGSKFTITLPISPAAALGLR
jgi:signal transduction histidine kinase